MSIFSWLVILVVVLIIASAIVSLRRRGATFGTVSTWVSSHLHLILGIGAVLALVILISMTVRSCSSATTTGSSISDSFFWKLFLAGFLVAAVIAYRSNPERILFPIVCLGGAILCLIIILNKLDNLFTWYSLGLLVIAGVGFWGARWFDGWIRSILVAFSIGVALIWLLNFMQTKVNVSTTFLGTRIDGDYLLILILAGALLILGICRNGKWWLIGFAIVLAAWLGPEVFNKIGNGFPIQLNPKTYVSPKTQSTWERIWDMILQRAEEAVKPGPTLPPSTLPPASTPPPPATSATLPKKELKKFRFPIDFFAGERVADQGSTVEIRDGGYAIFRVSDLPWRSDATYYLVFSVIRKTTGEHHLDVNGGRGGTFFLDHFASERVETCVFNFNSPGQSQFFHPGDNRFKISSPGDCIVIQNAYVHMEYWS